MKSGNPHTTGGGMKIILGIFLICLPFIIISSILLEQHGLGKLLLAWGAALAMTGSFCVGGYLLFGVG
jgi:hypothetical protein